MNRREFVGTAAPLMAGTYVAPELPPGDAADVKRAVEAYYAAYREMDRARYRACLTDDYSLLEDGELLDVNGDLAMMGTPGSGFQRTDAFDFRSVVVHGSVAYAVYFLTSDISDQQGPRHREWLESMILRRAGTRWRTALLHTTRRSKPGT
jgi:ketosteroid isomerase-like protein